MPRRGRVWNEVVSAEPGSSEELDDAQLDTGLRAVADFADQKSRWTFGHSPAVADLAAAAGAELRLPASDVVALRRAGLVHDLGRVGVPAAVWGRDGTLSRADWEKVRLHAYHTERALTRPEPLAVADVDHALLEDRPDRPGHPPQEAAAVLPGAGVPRRLPRPPPRDRELRRPRDR